MTSSIFGNGNRPGTVASAVSQVRAMGNPDAAYAQLYRTNPQFRAFMDSQHGKTPMQFLAERGVDAGQLGGFMR